MRKKILKVLKTSLVLALIFCMMISTVACNDDAGKKVEKDVTQQPKVEDKKEPDKVEEPATYTYQASTAATIITWNPHEYESADDRIIFTYTSDGLYGFFYNDTFDGYVVKPRMADGDPIDVTDKYVGKYNVPQDAKDRFAYRIKIKENLKWEDGTKITADDFIYSVKELLNYQIRNHRAFQGYDDVPLANAEKYNKQQEKMYSQVGTAKGEYKEIGDLPLYLSFKKPIAFFEGQTAESHYAITDEATNFFDGDTNLYEKYCDKSYVELTEEAKADLLKIAAKYGDTNPDAYLDFCYTLDGISPAVPWEDVGVVKVSDYEFDVIFDRQLANLFYVKYNLDSAFSLVNKKLYEENKKEVGDLIKTSYGTTIDNYIGYGPYKLVSYQMDKQIVFERNENWYGYNDPVFEGQYQPTKLVIDVVKEYNTRLQLFLQGKLERLALRRDDFEKYRTSENIYFDKTTYTNKMSINENKVALKARERDGINKSLLSYKEFRKGISLAFNREDWCDKVTSANPTSFTLINDQYIYRPSTAEAYRDTEEAKDVIRKLYGVQDETTVTGFDLEAAKKCFTNAYNEALANKDIKETDTVEIEYMFGRPLDELTAKQARTLEGYLIAATAGTPLEGRIKIVEKSDEYMWDKMEASDYDIVFCGWTGGAMDPYGFMIVYTQPGFKCEAAFDSENYMVTIAPEGEDITMSIYDWTIELAEGKYALADESIKLKILAAMEYALLENYHLIPTNNDVAAVLRSKKINDPVEEFVPIMGFGNEDVTQYVTFNYNDAEWEAYCKEHNNQLDY